MTKTQNRIYSVIHVQKFSNVAKGDSKYPICFEKASEWVGFSSKSNGKRHLVANFEENSDYIICSSKMGLTDFQISGKKRCVMFVCV